MRSIPGRLTAALPVAVLAGALAACNPATTASTPTAPPAATAAPTPGPSANVVSAPIVLTVTACTDASKQLCEPPATVTVWTEGALTVDFTASPAHCSDIIARIALDGAPARVSEQLAAGASTGPLDLGPVSPGAHVVSVQGEGVVSGCNSGGISSWSGSITFGITAGAAPYPTPMLGTPAP